MSGSEFVPYSDVHDIAVLGPDRVCLSDFYESHVLCGDRRWTAVDTLGRRGEGPGEFASPDNLGRTLDGGLIVIDYTLTRLTLFDSTGALRGTLKIPPIFHPLTPASGTIVVGFYATWSDSIQSAPVAWVSLLDGRIVREEVYRHVSEASASLGVPGAGVSKGAMAPDSSLVFLLPNYVLQRFAPDGTFLGEFGPMNMSSELPSERDVEEYVYGARLIFGSPPPASRIEEFRRKPIPPIVRGAELKFDDEGHLWVATTRDHETRSFLDVYRGDEQVGSVKVRGRLLSFDLYDDLLVVLAEHSTPGPDGLYPRSLDWYRVKAR